MHGAWVRKDEFLLGTVAQVARDGTALVVYEDGDEEVMSLDEICLRHWPEPLLLERYAHLVDSTGRRSSGILPLGESFSRTTPPAPFADPGSFQRSVTCSSPHLHRSLNSPPGGRRTVSFFVMLGCVMLLATLLSLAGRQAVQKQTSQAMHVAGTSGMPAPEVEGKLANAIPEYSVASVEPYENRTASFAWSEAKLAWPEATRAAQTHQQALSTDTTGLDPVASRQGESPHRLSLKPLGMQLGDMFASEDRPLSTAALRGRTESLEQASDEQPITPSPTPLDVATLELGILDTVLLHSALVASFVIIASTCFEVCSGICQRAIRAVQEHMALRQQGDPASLPQGLRIGGQAVDPGMRTRSEEFLPVYTPSNVGDVNLELEAECADPGEPEFELDQPLHPVAASLPLSPRIQLPSLEASACQEIAVTASEACVQSGPGLAGSVDIFIGAHYVARSFCPTSVVRLLAFSSSPGMVLALPCYRSTIRTFRQAPQSEAVEISASDLMIGPFVMMCGRPPAHVLQHIDQLLREGGLEPPVPLAPSAHGARQTTRRAAKAAAEMAELLVDGPRFRHRSKLRQLREMGFRSEDDQTLRRLLTEHLGNLEAVVAQLQASLVEGPEKQPTGAQKPASSGMGRELRVSLGGG